MGVWTFVSGSSKLLQLWAMWALREPQLACDMLREALTWGLLTFACAARLCTTAMTSGDRQLLARFGALALLDLLILLTGLRYRSAGAALEGQKQQQQRRSQALERAGRRRQNRPR